MHSDGQKSGRKTYYFMDGSCTGWIGLGYRRETNLLYVYAQKKKKEIEGLKREFFVQSHLPLH